MDKIVNNVYESTDYRKFKRLSGNRMVNEKAVDALVKSMLKYGWIGAPIIVNINMEVGDGQHRVEAAEKAGIAVQYEIQNWGSIEECIELNRNHKNWEIQNYIESYAERGNADYNKLLQKIDQFCVSGKLSRRVVMAVCQGHLQGINNSEIKSGTFAFSDEEKASRILNYLSGFDVSGIRGNKESVHFALNGIYRLVSVDNEKMSNQYEKYGSDIKRVTGTIDAVEQLEYIYNIRSSRRIYFVDKYKALANDMCAAIPGGKTKNA